MYHIIIITLLVLIVGYFSVTLFYLTNSDQLDKPRIINTLYRQCARWSAASTQDTNPLIANLHANYAAGYLWALEDLFTADDISAATKQNHKLFRAELQKNQDMTTKKISHACPNFVKIPNGSSELVAAIAGEL
jgi:hypothetical protein